MNGGEGLQMGQAMLLGNRIGNDGPWGGQQLHLIYFMGNYSNHYRNIDSTVMECGNI